LCFDPPVYFIIVVCTYCTAGTFLPTEQVHYLRPAYGLHDLDMWKEGLCGMNSNVVAACSLSAPVVSPYEAIAIQRDLHNR
jgi:hypothetical protein